jgi:hypothetical protein
MGVTFISNSGGAVKAGTIVLWFGAKADIPAGWAYYSAAAGKLVAGATTASTTAAGSATHTHAYSSNTGNEGAHTHSITLTIGQPINATLPNYFAPGEDNAYWAGRYHTNHSQSAAINPNPYPNHAHALSVTGGSVHTPPVYGLYYIRKA